MFSSFFRILLLLLLISSIKAQPIRTDKTPVNNEQTEQLTLLFYNLLARDADIRNKSLDFIDENWHPTFAPPLIDMLVITDLPKVKKQITTLLEKHTGQKIGRHLYDWLDWLWHRPPVYAPFYADLKAKMYRNIDTQFEEYFQNRYESATIRLDEILWGGVIQDGIPPLRDPEMISAEDAKYLYKQDIVFGIVINGQSRAYPKRIMGWHEMVVENVADRRIAGVYCTLCGTMIVYDTEFEGTIHNLGTSGFLYKSNKLMYDAATQSLWNTIEGTPVVGPLTKQNIKLKTYPVVVTNWETWKNVHPATKVLSLKTGYERNYLPGAAYKTYYSTDELMFPVPRKDQRMNNKDAVLVIRSEGYENDPLAISTDYLLKNRVYNDHVGEKSVVVITYEKGGSRVFEASDHFFKTNNNGILTDQNNTQWNVTDEWIINNKGIKLKRLPAHEIFWFAWFNAYPKTRLVN